MSLRLTRFRVRAPVPVGSPGSLGALGASPAAASPVDPCLVANTVDPSFSVDEDSDDSAPLVPSLAALVEPPAPPASPWVDPPAPPASPAAGPVAPAPGLACDASAAEVAAAVDVLPIPAADKALFLAAWDARRNCSGALATARAHFDTAVELSAALSRKLDSATLGRRRLELEAALGPEALRVAAREAAERAVAKQLAGRDAILAAFPEKWGEGDDAALERTVASLRSEASLLDCVMTVRADLERLLAELPASFDATDFLPRLSLPHLLTASGFSLSTRRAPAPAPAHAPAHAPAGPSHNPATIPPLTRGTRALPHGVLKAMVARAAELVAANAGSLGPSGGRRVACECDQKKTGVACRLAGCQKGVFTHAYVACRADGSFDETDTLLSGYIEWSANCTEQTGPKVRVFGVFEVGRPVKNKNPKKGKKP
jgi:hypothetical protein